MNTRWNTILVSLTCLSALFGCSQENRPKDMPRLYPVTLTITLDGQPLDNAFVVLHAETGPDAKWTIGGLTDSEGKAIIVTHGQFRGAPAGKFKVCVTKVEDASSSTDPDPYAGTVLAGSGSATSVRPSMIHRVDPLFGDPNSTTLEIEIGPKGQLPSNLTFDVHKPH